MASEALASRFEVKADAGTHFAWLRTRLAVERTVMAWARTSVSLIGFGFTIFQFFDRLNSMTNVHPAARPATPWYFALSLIGAGIIGLVISLFEYRWMIGYLWSQEFAAVAGVGPKPWNTPIVFIILLLIAVGLVALSAVFLRVT